MIVCGHTKNQKDEFRDCNDLTSIYIHIIGFAYTYFDSDWKDDTDKATAQADFGKVVLKKGITGYFCKAPPNILTSVFCPPIIYIKNRRGFL